MRMIYKEIIFLAVLSLIVFGAKLDNAWGWMVCGFLAFGFYQYRHWLKRYGKEWLKKYNEALERGNG